MEIRNLETPCLLVNKNRVKQNVKKISDFCLSLGISLRPMMKTHKCIEIGDIATNNSKRCIAVSTIAEAKNFAEAGYDDIVYSHLFTADKIKRLKSLAETLSNFQLTIDSYSGLQLLEDNPLVGKKWNVLLMIDVGGGRDGIPWNDASVVDLATKVFTSSSVALKGLYSHEGNSYHVSCANQTADIATTSVDQITSLAKKIREAGIDVFTVGLGATPTSNKFSTALHGLTELHPGNFIFYDAQQASLGSCSVDEIAVKVATRIIGHYPHRKQFLVDAGFLALSHDGKLKNGSYCIIDGHPDLILSKMTQEVGIVESLKEDINFDNFPIGMMLFLLPYHSCATAAMYSQYLIHEGDQITDVWTPCRGW